MYCPEKLKLNKFKDVAIPSPRDFMARFGAHALPDAQFTGEEEAVDFENRKVELMHTAEEEMAYRSWLAEQERENAPAAENRE